MVRHAAAAKNRTIKAVTYPAQIMLRLVQKVGVLHKRPSILRRKKQVDVNLSKGLPHGGTPLMVPFQGTSRMVTSSQGALRVPGLCEKTPLGFDRSDRSFGN